MMAITEPDNRTNRTTRRRCRGEARRVGRRASPRARCHGRSSRAGSDTAVMCRLAGAAPEAWSSRSIVPAGKRFHSVARGSVDLASDLSRLSRERGSDRVPGAGRGGISPGPGVAAAPGRASLVLAGGRGQDAVGHCAAVLAADPTHVGARSVMARALGGGPDAPQPPPLASSASTRRPRPSRPAPSRPAAR